MQVHLSTSSSEDITNVLCVRLSYFFSLLSCFLSHKPLLILSAETVNSLLRWLSWPELLSALHSWHHCAVGLVHSWWLRFGPRGLPDRAEAGSSRASARAELWHQGWEKKGVLCLEVRNIYVKCTGRGVQTWSEKGQPGECRDCGERHVLVGEERYQGPGMGNAQGEGRERSRLSGAEGWKVSVVWGGLGRLQKTFGSAGRRYRSARSFSLLPMNLFPHTNGMGKQRKVKTRRSAVQWSCPSLPSLEKFSPQHHTLTPTTGQWHIHPSRERDVRSEGSWGGSGSRFPSLPGERTGKSRQKSQSCGSQGWS